MEILADTLGSYDDEILAVKGVLAEALNVFRSSPDPIYQKAKVSCMSLHRRRLALTFSARQELASSYTMRSLSPGAVVGGNLNVDLFSHGKPSRPPIAAVSAPSGPRAVINVEKFRKTQKTRRFWSWRKTWHKRNKRRCFFLISSISRDGPIFLLAGAVARV